jgi:hypothetical protein
MRGILLVILAVASLAACNPGSGENGTCTSTPECQLNLDCRFLLADGGGICKYPCSAATMNCPGGSPVCTSGGYCSKDGGIY